MIVFFISLNNIEECMICWYDMIAIKDNEYLAIDSVQKQWQIEHIVMNLSCLFSACFFSNDEDA